MNKIYFFDRSKGTKLVYEANYSHVPRIGDMVNIKTDDPDLSGVGKVCDVVWFVKSNIAGYGGVNVVLEEIIPMPKEAIQ